MDTYEQQDTDVTPSAFERVKDYLIEGSKDTPKWVWSVVALVVFFLAMRALAPLTSLML